MYKGMAALSNSLRHPNVEADRRHVSDYQIRVRVYR